MPLDEPIEVLLRQLGEDAGLDGNDFLRATIISGLLSGFPIAGPVIDNLIRNKAARNVNRRIVELFVEMGNRLREIKDSIPDVDYFGSEEFQTLLTLAIEQLQTSHDEAKRKMLAAALANSGSTGFSGDPDKEQYVRTLRDLSPVDLDTLTRLAPQSVPHPHISEVRNAPDTILCSLSRLTALGLVAESLTPKRPPPAPGWNSADAARAFFAMATQLPDRGHRISDYGQRFLKFPSAG